MRRQRAVVAVARIRVELVFDPMPTTKYRCCPNSDTLASKLGQPTIKPLAVRSAPQALRQSARQSSKCDP